MATSYVQFAETFKVGLCQINPKPLDPEHNFNTAAKYIRSAASEGASLAVLPEYHLSGWEPSSPEFTVIAETAYQYVGKYQELARELKINIIPGTIVTVDPNPPPTTDGTIAHANGSSNRRKPLLNIAPFISYTGEVLGSYAKANLWLPERSVLTSGPHHSIHTSEGPPPAPSPHSVIETPLGPVGIVICWDLAFPEAFRSLVRQGARIIVIPTFWTRDDLTPEARAYGGPDIDIKFLQNAVITRSFENTCAIIFCNVGGPSEEGYAGLSQVVLPLVGKVEGSFDDNEVGVRVVEVDMRTVDVAEENYQIRADMRRDDWHYGYSHEKRQ